MSMCVRGRLYLPVYRYVRQGVYVCVYVMTCMCVSGDTCVYPRGHVSVHI